jgi:hypothetical protein
MSPTDFSRRRFLGLIGATAVVATPVVRPVLGSEVTGARWSDPRTWGGRVPGATDVALVSRTIVLDRNTQVGGVVVAEGGRLIFDRDKSVTLTTRGNVVVRGRLVMRPRNPRKKHRLVFQGVDERAFVGGGVDPVDSDVGLWVMDGGELVIVGAGKKSWSRAAEAVSSGARSVTLKAKPSGWRRGDNIVITPTGATSDSDHFTRFDGAAVRSIQGKHVGLSVPTSAAHPAVKTGKKTFTAEVLNLTRNVIIQGTPGGRSHIFIRSNRPQRIENCLIRYMGPRKNDLTILGRWPLHFHQCFKGSQGSIVKGVVARDVGSHAFVAHASHGVTFRNCIAYNVVETPFWWDHEPKSGTLDALYDRCVAAKCLRGNSNVAGFAAFRGAGNRMRGCVAVGVQTRFDTSAGFQWPGATDEGLWDEASNLVAHNNQGPGIRFWSNSDIRHHIDPGSAFFNNDGVGILHGAYGNVVTYDGVTAVGNRKPDTRFHARTPESGNQRQEWTNSDLGRVWMEMNIGNASSPILVRNCTVESITVESRNETPLTAADFVRCTKDGADIKPGDVIWELAPIGWTLRFKRLDGTCWKYEMTNSGSRVVDPIPDFE